jgi:hypothetical protein
MKLARKIIMALWTVLALIAITIGYTDKAIFAMCWAIFMQLQIIEDK